MEIMLHKSFSQNKLRKCSINNVDKYHTNFRKHYTVTYVLSLKRNVTNVFFIFTFLKNCNLHQFSGKIRSENVTYVLLSSIILYVPIKSFKNWSYQWKERTKKPQTNYLKNFFRKFVTYVFFVLKQQSHTSIYFIFSLNKSKLYLLKKLDLNWSFILIPSFRTDS